MNMRPFFGVAALCFMIGTAGAQTDNYIPPSPTAASLALSSDVQVGEYTGIPSINLPLYTLTSGDISLPITLSYQSSGIRVEQEASWVGLGWSLSIGGVITRQIRGREDFTNEGYISARPLPPNTQYNLPQAGSPNDDQYAEDFSFMATGYLDGEPDLFYYNFNGQSGKFMFQKGQSGNVLTPTPLSLSNIKFVYDKNVQQWTVTDEKGFKYYFGTIEQTWNHSCPGSSRYPLSTCYDSTPVPANITSWYLDRIESPSGAFMNFTYDKGTGRRTFSQVQRGELLYHMIDEVIYTDYLRVAMPQLAGIIESHSAIMQEVSDVFLTEVSGNNGRVVCSLGDRTDMVTASGETKFLDYLQVYDVNNVGVKTFDFVYGYFNPGQSADLQRLRLDAVQEISGNVSKPPHAFTYNATMLPSKVSTSVDHWGFYNGKNNDQIRNYRYLEVEHAITHEGEYTTLDEPEGTTFKASTVPAVDYMVAGKNIFFSGADRQPNEDIMKAGILTGVKYPTGGSTEFEYESNTYSSPDPSGDPLFTFIPQPINVIGSSEEVSPYKQVSFTLTERTMVTLDYVFQKTQGSGTYVGAESGVKKSNGAVVVKMTPNNDSFESHITICLPAGQYYIYVDFTQVQTKQFYFHQLKGTYNIHRFATQLKGGGLRVSKITSKDGLGSIANIDHYVYDEGTPGQGLSYGKLMRPLTYFYTENMQSIVLNPLGVSILTAVGDATYVVRNSTSCIPFGNSAQGSPIGYSRVVKYQENSSGVRNGMTISYFRNKPEVEPVYFMPGAPSFVFNDNGLPAEKSEYNGDGKPVRRQFFQYAKEASQDIIIKGVKTYTGISLAYSGDVRFYDNVAEWWHPTLDSTCVYDAEGSASYLKTSNQYYFDNGAHRLLTRKTSETSDGSVTTTTRYPSDINTGVYAQMASLNKLNFPVEETVSRNGGVVNGKITTYKSSNTDYVPDEVYTLESNIPLPGVSAFDGVTKDVHYADAADVKFGSYGTNSRVQQVTGRNGIITAYLWDATGNYLMAQIQGATYDQVSSQEGKPATYDCATLWHNLSGLIAHGLIRTFTYKASVGLQSQIDVAGQRSTYDYDDLGRLVAVRDNNGHILQSYNYHYKK